MFNSDLIRLHVTNNIGPYICLQEHPDEIVDLAYIPYSKDVAIYYGQNTKLANADDTVIMYFS